MFEFLLFNVAEGSSKMREIDPDADAQERTWMGSARWKDEYSCDCLRLDNQHQDMLNSLATACCCIDGTVNIKQQIESLQNTLEIKPTTELRAVKNIVDAVQKEREQLRDKLSEEDKARLQAIDDVITNGFKKTIEIPQLKISRDKLQPIFSHKSSNAEQTTIQSRDLNIDEEEPQREIQTERRRKHKYNHL
ncbi:MAG: hypothetical protein EZS28_011061 [Streblomastix strix]|uniref:Uncharacterized protein n=1 Tax=Streblomastix strix TaxID=222440 RepID=A0A5J4WGB1_9EUKA|nr:MAG: hypothetical protein EZS28_011061 [Streblomastix strix]